VYAPIVPAKARHRRSDSIPPQKRGINGTEKAAKPVKRDRSGDLARKIRSAGPRACPSREKQRLKRNPKPRARPGMKEEGPAARRKGRAGGWTVSRQRG